MPDLVAEVGERPLGQLPAVDLALLVAVLHVQRPRVLGDQGLVHVEEGADARADSRRARQRHGPELTLRRCSGASRRSGAGRAPIRFASSCEPPYETQRQRHADHGREAEHHGDVDDRGPEQHAPTTPTASIAPKPSLELLRDHEAPDQHAQVEHEQHAAADEAPLLGQHREREVGVLGRQEAELRLRAFEVALADEAARADRDAATGSPGSRTRADRARGRGSRGCASAGSP